MSWRTVPLVRPLLFLILGILLGNYFPVIPLPFLLIFCFVLLLLLVGFQRKLIPYQNKRYFGGLILLSFTVIGTTLSIANSPDQNPNHLIHFQEDSIKAVGVVRTAPSVNNTVQVQIDILSKENIGHFAKVIGKVLVFFSIDEKSLDLGIGDKILLEARINRTKSSSNPLSFDFKKYFANKGIYHQAHVIDWKYIDRKNGFLKKIGNQRQKLLNILSHHLPTENEYAVGAALCLGSKDALSDEIKNEYASTGAMHVLAISGLHVGIIFGFLLRVFSVFKTRKTHWLIVKIITTIFLLWVYALFTGGSPSVLRAALMFSFLTVSIYLKTNVTIYNTLAAAAICMLVYDPLLIFDVGFQLSYTAVIGIVYFYPKIYAWLYFDNWVVDYFWQISAVGIAAQLATFPIGLYYFHHLPTLFLLTGFFVVPIASLAIITCIALFIAHYIFAGLAVWVGYLLYGFIWFNNSLIHLIANLGKGFEQYFFIGLSGLIILYLCLLCFDQFFKRGKYWFLLCGMFALFGICSTNMYYNFTKDRAGYLCVYELGQDQLLDLGYQSERVSFSNLDAAHKKIKYASDNLRKFHGVFKSDNKNQKILHLEQISLIDDKRIAYLQDESLPGTKTFVDYLILSSEAIDLNAALKVFNFGELVINGNIPSPTKSGWINTLNEKELSYHDIKSDGAFYRCF